MLVLRAAATTALRRSAAGAAALGRGGPGGAGVGGAGYMRRAGGAGQALACRSACGKENRNGQLSQKQSFPSWLRTSNYIHFSDILRTESSFTLVFDLLSAELTFHFLPNNAFLPYSRNTQHQHEMVT